MRTLDQLLEQRGGDLSGTSVLVRSDLNVPLDGARITDDGRVRASVPTWQLLLDAGARVVVCAHLGRPKGAPEARYSLRPVHGRIAELLPERVVRFADDTVGPSAQAAAGSLGDGELLLVENLRFEPGETAKDADERGAFADRLAALVGGQRGQGPGGTGGSFAGGLFVSDGFGVVHRKQASVYDVAQRLEHAAGLLVAAELAVLRRLTTDPQRPFAVVLGGAKTSDKLGVIDNLLGSLLTTGDALLVGGGMAFTFLAAQGHEVGTSLLEADQLDAVRGYLDLAERRGVRVLLPTDVVAATAFSADADREVVPADAIPADRMGLDVGPATSEAFAAVLRGARTVFWNGPMGAFEMAPYAEGTRALADALVGVGQEGGLTVVGGGDSAAAVRQLGFQDDAFGHISTGGGASLEFLEGEELPGLTALDD